MIPNNAELIKTLNSLYIRTVEPDEIHSIAANTYVACEPIHSEPNDPRMIPFVVVEQRKKTKIPIKSLIDRVAKGLIANHHGYVKPSSETTTKLATKVIAFAALTKYRFDTLESIKRHIELTSVWMWAVTSLPANDIEHRFGQYTLGHINFQHLCDVSEQAGSDYHKKPEKHLPKNFQTSLCITRKEARERIIDFTFLMKTPNATLSSEHYDLETAKYLAYRLIDDYYTDLAMEAQSYFYKDFDYQQAIFTANGASSIPSRFLQLNPILKLAFITAFNSEEFGHGWVVPTVQFPYLRVSTLKLISEQYSGIKNNLRLSNWGQFPLDKHLDTFCQYLQKASNEPGLEESLLFKIFALDMLLGGTADQPQTATLASRTAALCFRTIKKDFEFIVKFVKKTYDFRSSYVHRGQLGKLEDENHDMPLLERNQFLENLCRVVLAAGIYVRHKHWCVKGNAREEWIKKVDFLIASHNAGKEEPTDDVAELGLSQVHINNDSVPKINIDWS